MDLEFKLEIIFFISIIVFAIGLIIGGIYLDYAGAATYKGYTVTDKAVKNDDKESKYLVYTVDNEGEVMVFSVEDRFWIGRFDASDDYARIVIGKTYDFETVGVRSHFFSSYPSIIEMKER